MDISAFEAAFGNDLPVAGTYTGRLDNGGENLLLIAADQTPIQSLRYHDRAPWPLPSDGGGYSLTLISPESNPDLGEAASWRASVHLGGSPGRSDTLPFTGSTPNELLAYALDNPLAGITALIQNLEVKGSFDDYLVATISAKVAADDAQISVEFSPDLENWQSGTAVYLGSDEGSDGVTLRHWRAPLPVTSGTPVRYARLVLTARL